VSPRRRALSTGVVTAVGLVAVTLVAAGMPGQAYGDDQSVTPTTVASGCSISSSGYEICGIGTGSPGSPGDTTTTLAPRGSEEPTTTSPYHYIWVLAQTYFNDGNNYLCDAEGDHETLAAGAPIPPGWVELYVQEEETNSGTVVDTSLVCGSEPTPTTLPPPTPEQAWGVAGTLLPSANIQFSPGDNGLVHLQTWFWLSNDAAGTPVTVTATTGTGQSVTAIVEPVGYNWNFGNGDTGYSTSAGTEAQPAERYTYVDAGTYEVSVSVVWQGNYYDADDGDLLGALGPVTAPASFAPYQVRQIRSVLTAGSG
jgi:hypothetical protein